MLTTWQPMAEAEFRARFRFSCEVENISETPYKRARRPRPTLSLSDLYSERGLVLLVNGPLIDGVWHRQVDHFTEKLKKKKTSERVLECGHVKAGFFHDG